MDGNDEQHKQIELERERVPTQQCPQCGFVMMAVRGSKEAVCRNCGFKDSCCY